MPSVEQNESEWGDPSSWTQRGDEWSETWGGPPNHWAVSLQPRLQAFLPAGRILEIAPGYGRWTQFLVPLCSEYVGVDLAPSCIEGCRERFATAHNAQFHVNDGRTLPMVQDRTIDLAFSFDSLVHAERDVLAAYVRELDRVLADDGVAFLHHSNMGAYRPAYRRAEFLHRVVHRIPRLRAPLHKAEVIDWMHWRAPSMSAVEMQVLCANGGLACVGQELVTWGGRRRLIDCFSLLTRRGSRWDRPAVIERNPDFMGEAISAGRQARVYGTF